MGIHITSQQRIGDRVGGIQPRQIHILGRHALHIGAPAFTSAEGREEAGGNPEKLAIQAKAARHRLHGLLEAMGRGPVSLQGPAQLQDEADPSILGVVIWHPLRMPPRP